jgi:hypothetical protein
VIIWASFRKGGEYVPILENLSHIPNFSCPILSNQKSRWKVSLEKTETGLVASRTGFLSLCQG